MNVLFVSARFPYPLDTGAKIRTFNLLRWVSQRHKTTLLTFSESPEDKQHLPLLQEHCHEVVLVPKRPHGRAGVNGKLGLVTNLFSSLPYTISRYSSAAMSEEIARVVRRNSIQLIHCDHLHVAQNVPRCEAKRLLNEHNVEAMISKRLAQTFRNPLSRGYMELQWRKLERYEAEVCSQFDHCVVVSEEDKRTLLSMCGQASVSVIENGVDTEYFQPVKVPKVPNSLVFTGAMDWMPNEDAVLYFCDAILPLIRQAVPEVQVFIVGRNPSQRLRDRCVAAKVQVTGSVPDVRPYVAQGSVFVVPLRSGGGTRLKILEAMAMGVPCVSTTIGCEGLRVSDGRDIVVADAPQEFADGVARLLGNPTQCAEMGVAGRQLVEQSYDWRQIGLKLAEVYERVASV
ncbi:MAG: glycosyltransferase [Planctomycetes bacterium]|nr:glycosyltransferase [Planctomycetota bacterium]